MNPSRQESRGIWAWDLVKFILGLSALLFALLYWTGGFTEASTRAAIRWSARISVLMFCLAFGASSIHYFMKNSFSFWILMNRKYWGISFAIIHLVHLAFLGVLQYFFHPVFTLAASISLFAGGMAYVFLILMLLTSFDAFAAKMSRRNWTFLHTIGAYWIWVIFARSYWKRVLFENEYSYLPLALSLVIVLLARILKKISEYRLKG